MASPTELLDGDTMIWQDLKGEDGRFHFEPLDISQSLLEKTSKGNKKVYEPNVFFYLVSVAGDEYDDVFNPSMSEKLKCVVDKRGVRYRNKTLWDT